MVRKRARSSRKYYDSDENEDSDVDFDFEETHNVPVRKKYSLRQRKRPLITQFDYEDEEEDAPPKHQSDDEDFELEKELELEEAATSEHAADSPYINHYQPETDEINDPNGLIDFEDMIRADIVVNKNRIDYDNVIQKTEIKVQPLEQQQQLAPVKSKRGRKPKKRPENEIDSSLLEPETEVQEADYDDKNDLDYIPGDEELRKCPQQLNKSLEANTTNKLALSCNNQTTESNTDESNLPNDTDSNKIQHENNTEALKSCDHSSIHENDEEKSSEESSLPVDEHVDSPNHVNGDIDKQSLEVKTETSQDTNEDDDDDDDVVLIEDKKCEVIVLDD